MTCCAHCRDAEGFFGRRTARRELRRYRKRGPGASTRLLIEGLRKEGVAGRTLLDVGGGIGAIQHELFQDGLERATHVDASQPYLEAAREEADRRGHEDRIEYRYGDVVDLAPELQPADIVTLDRVICCYPDLDRLLGASLAKARHTLGLVFPRERWGTRVALALANLYFRLRGSAFRTYVHPIRAVEGRVHEAGFRRGDLRETFLWRIAVYVRSA